MALLVTIGKRQGNRGLASSCMPRFEAGIDGGRFLGMRVISLSR
jgi:hypothetical protein